MYFLINTELSVIIETHIIYYIEVYMKEILSGGSQRVDLRTVLRLE